MYLPNISVNKYTTLFAYLLYLKSGILSLSLLECKLFLKYKKIPPELKSEQDYHKNTKQSPHCTLTDIWKEIKDINHRITEL